MKKKTDMEFTLNLTLIIMIIGLQHMTMATDENSKVKGERSQSPKPILDECNQWDRRCGHVDNVKDEIRTNPDKPRHIYRSEELLEQGLRELLFHCGGDELLEFSHVCNDELDCSNGQDEEHCFLDDANDKGRDKTDCNMTCPDYFTCYKSAVIAENKTAYIKSLDIVPCGMKMLNLNKVNLYKIETPHTLPGLVTLELSECSITNLSKIFTNDIMVNTVTVDLSLNDLKEMKMVEDISIFPNLVFLNLSFNPNLTVIQYAAITTKVLRVLDISYTRVSSLVTELFDKNYMTLRYINLKKTEIGNLEFLAKITSLDILDIEGIPITPFEAVTQLRHISIKKSFKTDIAYLCCPGLLGPGIPDVVCHSPSLEHSNCQGLLPDPNQKYVLWLVAVFSFCFNMFVIAYRVLFDYFNFKRNYGIFVLSLGIADILTSIYLLMISSVDSWYGAKYYLTENAWRNSHLCAFASYLSSCSFIVSNMISFLIALDRFLAMKNTFGKSVFTTKMVQAVVAFAWLIGVTVASVPHLKTKWMSHSDNGLCIALPFTTAYKRDVGPYSIGVFLFAHTFLFLFIVASLLAMLLLSIYKTKRSGAVHRRAARRREDLNIRTQIFLIAFSHFLSWCPMFTLGVLTQYKDYVISPGLYAWIMITCFPLNAVLNPMIYSGRAIFRGIVASFRRYKTNLTEKSRANERASRFRIEKEDVNDHIELQEL